MISPLWRLHAIILATVLVFAHQNVAADILRQEYPIADVRQVSVSNAAHLTIRQGNSETLFVEATEEGLTRVEVKQNGDRLSLEVKPSRAFFWSWFNRNRDQVHFILEVQDLERLAASGAVEVWLEELNSRAFRLNVSGASQVNMAHLRAETTRMQVSGASKVLLDRIDTQTLDVEVYGASQVEVNAGEPIAILIVQASGASSFEASTLAATEANVDVSGASKAYVRAIDQLNVDASGASRVDYIGNPRIQQNTSGASSVRSQR